MNNYKKIGLILFAFIALVSNINAALTELTNAEVIKVLNGQGVMVYLGIGSGWSGSTSTQMALQNGNSTNNVVKVTTSRGGTSSSPYFYWKEVTTALPVGSSGTYYLSNDPTRWAGQSITASLKAGAAYFMNNSWGDKSGQYSSNIFYITSPSVSIPSTARTITQGETVTITSTATKGYRWSPYSGVDTKMGIVYYAKDSSNKYWKIGENNSLTSNGNTTITDNTTLTGVAELPVGTYTIYAALKDDYIHIKAANTFTLTVNAPTEPTYTVTVSIATGQTTWGNVDGNTSPFTVEVTASTWYTITAAANAGLGYEFDYWEVGTGITLRDANTAPAAYIKATQASTMIAHFKENLSSVWYMRGETDGAKTDDLNNLDWSQNREQYNFLYTSGERATNIAHLRLNLTKGQNLTFKLCDDSNWRGNSASGVTLYATTSNLDFSGEGNNLTVNTVFSGEYDFELNTNSMKLTVTYPAPSAISGSWNDWDTDTNPLTGTNPKTANITLAADSWLTFKVVNTGEWLGYGDGTTNITASSNSRSGLTTTGNNLNLATTMAGSYTFSYNTTSKTITVTYPTIPAMTGTLSLARNTTGAWNTSAPIISGSGTASNPYLVYEGKKLYLLATHSSAPTANSHFYYEFNHNGTSTIKHVSTSTNATTDTIVASGVGTTKYVEVSAYYEYGPDGGKAHGTAVTSNKIYYKVMECPEISLTPSVTEAVYNTGNVKLTINFDGHGIGAALSSTPYYYYVKRPGMSSFAEMNATIDSSMPTATNPLTTNFRTTKTTYTPGTYQYYAIVVKDGYSWISDTVTVKAYKPITITAKTPSATWYNVMVHYWGCGFEDGDAQTEWLLDTEEGGVSYKYFTYTFKTTGTANFLMYCSGTPDISSIPGEKDKQTADITITSDKCYNILTTTYTSGTNNGKRQHEETDACPAIYRIKSDTGSKIYYSNTSYQDGDTLSYFASSTGTLTLQKLGSDWENVKTLSNPASSNVYIAIVDADNDDVTDVAVYEGDYYIHTNICPGQNPDWKHYPQMTAAERDSARMTYFEPNDNYPNELYNHYWVRYVGTDINVNAQVGNKYNMYLAEEIGAWPPYTNASTGKPIAPANIRFGYNPQTNWFGRNFIAGSSASNKDFVSAYAVCGMYEYDSADPTPTVIIDSLNYVKFTDISNWVYELDVMAVKTSECYPQVIVRSGYGKETPLFGEGVTQNILGNGTTNGNYHMRLTYDYKTNRIIAGWIPDDEEVGSIILEGNLIIQRTMNEDASHVLVTAGDEVVEVKQIYTVLTLGRDADWTANGPDANGYYYFWISLPYECFVGDVFGIPGYGSTWTMQRYRGDLRARDGWFKETPTFWHDMRAGNLMKPGQGYVIRIKKSAIDFKEIDGKASVRLFFPSRYEYEYTIAPATSTTQTVPTYICTIERDDRTKEDSNWNVIGVPGFSDNQVNSYTAQDDSHAKEAAPKYYYSWEWNSSTKEGQYTASDIKSATFRSTFAYMLQFGGTLTWKNAYSAANFEILPQYRTAHQRKDMNNQAANNEINRMLRLTLSDVTGQEDVTFVELTEEATSGYDLNQDLSKIMASRSLQLYTIGAERDAVDENGEAEKVISRFAGNNLPLTDVSVPVGINIPQAGEYTFAANGDEINGLTPILYDAVEERYINLLFDNYSVTLPAGTDETRFSLQLGITQPAVPTEEQAANDVFQITYTQQGLLISGLSEATAVELYDPLGRLLFQSSIMPGEIIPAPQTGVYLLRLNGQVLRVIKQ